MIVRRRHRAAPAAADVTIVTRSAPTPAGGRRAPIAPDVRDTAALGEFSATRSSTRSSTGWASRRRRRRPPQAVPDRTGQYVFISTCSVFGAGAAAAHHRVQPRRQPSSPRRDKIACELLLEEAYARRFPLTIVRPSTPTTAPIPVLADGPAIERMRTAARWCARDGTSLWVLDARADLRPRLRPDRLRAWESVNVSCGESDLGPIHLTLAARPGCAGAAPAPLQRAIAVHVRDEVLEHDSAHDA